MRARIVCIVVAFNFLAPIALGQDAAPAMYLKEAFIRVTESASDNAKLGNFGYDTGICILGAWIDCRDDAQFWVSLKKDSNYMFVAGGDRDAQDLQIDIYDIKENFVVGEKRVAPDAAVTLSPPADGWYKLKLTVVKSNMNLYCMCVLCVLKQGGYQIPLRNLDESAERLLRNFNEIDKSLQKTNQRLDFHKARNQWGLYGAVLSQGDSKTVTDIDFGGKRRGLLALGDRNTQDVDLYVLDKTQQNILYKDDKEASDAFVAFDPVFGARYCLKMLNFRGQGPSVVMTGIFEVKNRTK